MSLIQQVAAEVLLRGKGCADTIQIQGKTREQVLRALQNAAQLRLIQTKQARSAGHHKGRLPNVYGPIQAKPVQKPAASVWDYAQRSA